MKAKKIYLVTHNPDKVLEFQQILSTSVDILDLDITEIQALDVTDVAISKAKTAYEITGKNVIVEDTGFYLNAWSGFPGAFTRWFLESLGVDGICSILKTEKNRLCYIKTSLVICVNGSMNVFTSTLDGEIIDSPRGLNGFGFDKIIKPLDNDKSLAELSSQEKNAISTRRQVVEQLEIFITETFK